MALKEVIDEWKESEEKICVTCQNEDLLVENAQLRKSLEEALSHQKRGGEVKRELSRSPILQRNPKVRVLSPSP